MKPVTLSQESRAIVYDADVLSEVSARLFDAEYWREHGVISGSAPGRGNAWFIDAPWGDAVLRRYRRGGFMAKLTQDRYLYTGLERTRPFREFNLLRRMSRDGLRVPQPVAAGVQRKGWSYEGALITRRIANVEPLDRRFTDDELNWERLGAQLRAFHDAGMNHADLNARNLLLDGDSDDLWVLDLDASKYTPGRPVNGQSNLQRLERSLRKLWPSDAPDLASRWTALREGHGS